MEINELRKEFKVQTNELKKAIKNNNVKYKDRWDKLSIISSLLSIFFLIEIWGQTLIIIIKLDNSNLE